MKDNFTGYRILSWCFAFVFFPFNTLDTSLNSLLACLHGFWDVRCNSYLCSFIREASPAPILFQNVSLYLWLSEVWIWLWGGDLSCSVFSELPGSVLSCLTLIGGNSQSLLLQTFLPSLSIFSSGIPLHQSYLCSCPQFLDSLSCSVLGFFFLSLFSLYFSVLEVSSIISSKLKALSLACPVY